MKQYFKFKLKDEYLPEFIKELINEGKILCHWNEVLSIDIQYLRLLKIKNLENNISKKDKEFLELLLDKRCTSFITNEEYDFMIRVSTHRTTHPYNSYSSKNINYSMDTWI